MIVFEIVLCLLWIILASYTLRTMRNTEIEEYMNIIQVIDKKEFKKQSQHEYHEIFENLEEAILLFSENRITFSNQAFNEIMNGLNISQEESENVKDSLLDIKFFRLYRSEEMYSNQNEESMQDLRRRK